MSHQEVPHAHREATAIAGQANQMFTYQSQLGVIKLPPTYWLETQGAFPVLHDKLRKA